MHINRKYKTKGWLVFLMVFLLILTGCSDDDSDTPGDKNETPSEKEDKPKEDNTKKVYKVGDLIEEKNFSIKVNSAEVTDGHDFMTSDDGDKFIILDITIENKSDEEMNISSLLSFTLKDEDGRDQDYALNIEQKGQLDGTILGDEKMTGQITFEVPKEGKLTLYFTNDLFGKPLKIEVR